MQFSLHVHTLSTVITSPFRRTRTHLWCSAVSTIEATIRTHSFTYSDIQSYITVYIYVQHSRVQFLPFDSKEYPSLQEQMKLPTILRQLC